MKFYVNRSIHLRWRKELRQLPPAAQVFSPYITSKIAESVLSQAASMTCEIYTRFEADLFASGASSLPTLKRLLELGHDLFHVPELHAKIILLPNLFASIGSQNLTSAGTRNKEASIATNAAADVDRIAAGLRPWIEERVPITGEMIADMEELLPDVKRLYQEAQAAAQKVNEEVELRRLLAEAQLIAREAEELRRIQRLEQRRLRLLDLTDSVKRVRSSRESAYCYVGKPDRRSPRVSLMTNRKTTLISWQVHGKQIDLTSRKRYLCMLEHNGRLGWARVVKTVITFIGQSLVRRELVELDGQLRKVILRADWSAAPQYGRNLTIEIHSRYESPLCSVSVWFSPEDITLLATEPADEFDFFGVQASLIQWIEENWDVFKEVVHPLIVAPFFYTENLTGRKATDYFGPRGTLYQLRVMEIQEHPVLSAVLIK